MTDTAKHSKKSDEREKREEDEEEDDSAETFQAYFEYNRILRTWFVGFGIGGPAIFLINEKVGARLAEAHLLKWVVMLFLCGAAAQILGAFFNKVANWYVYEGTIDDKAKGGWRHKLAEWYVDHFALDILFDVTSITAFGWAAWLLLTVFSKVS
jgi:hypothetical protein